MPCYNPIYAYRSKDGPNPKTGSWPIVFNPKMGTPALNHQKLCIPCGICIGCKMDRAYQWTQRCTHEAQMHKKNSFITLTYDNNSIDDSYSLNREDFPAFMKRLRDRLKPLRISFFQCGEYGENLQRPHHHAIIFGYDFPDRNLKYTNKNGDIIYGSKILREAWGHGNVSCGDVCIKSIAYVCGYVLQKQYGADAKGHYDDRVAPYNTMSRRPAIGQRWIDAYSGDVYGYDRIVTEDNKFLQPPKFYDKWLEKRDPDRLKQIKAERRDKAQASPDYDKWDRLKTKEQIIKMSIDKMERYLLCHKQKFTQ